MKYPDNWVQKKTLDFLDWCSSVYSLRIINLKVRVSSLWHADVADVLPTSPGIVWHHRLCGRPSTSPSSSSDERLSATWEASVSNLIRAYQPLDQHLSATWWVPISRLIRICQPVDQNLSASWSAPVSHFNCTSQPIYQQLSGARAAPIAAWSLTVSHIISTC